MQDQADESRVETVSEIKKNYSQFPIYSISSKQCHAIQDIHKRASWWAGGITKHAIALALWAEGSSQGNKGDRGFFYVRLIYSVSLVTQMIRAGIFIMFVASNQNRISFAIEDKKSFFLRSHHEMIMMTKKTKKCNELWI